jgi:UDP-3-O-[3-hydroxymyristoyl] glucosamine N-acyltransferase
MPGNSYICVAPDVKLGRDVRLSTFINLYGCEIGDETKIGAFVEVQKNAKIGKRCKISSHTFVCEGVTITGSHSSTTVIRERPAPEANCRRKPTGELSVL